MALTIQVSSPESVNKDTLLLALNGDPLAGVETMLCDDEGLQVKAGVIAGKIKEESPPEYCVTFDSVSSSLKLGRNIREIEVSIAEGNCDMQLRHAVLNIQYQSD